MKNNPVLLFSSKNSINEKLELANENCIRKNGTIQFYKSIKTKTKNNHKRKINVPCHKILLSFYNKSYSLLMTKKKEESEHLYFMQNHFNPLEILTCIQNRNARTDQTILQVSIKKKKKRIRTIPLQSINPLF